MEKIDRLGWAAGISFTSYGLRVGIRVNDPQVLESLTARLPPGWKPAPTPVVDRLYSIIAGGRRQRPGVRRFSLLYENHVRIARTLNLEQIIEALASTLRLHVAEMARRRLFVHAGVVGWRGRAILLPGRSFSGKTTLVAELVRTGATYYSDEYAVLDARGRVHPFPKPLSIREAGRVEQRDCTVEELGGRAGVKPLPVGLVVVSEYKAGARWRPQALTPGVGTLALLSNTVAARREPEKALAILQQVVTQAPVLKGVRGEAESVARAILAYLDNSKSASLRPNNPTFPIEQQRT